MTQETDQIIIQLEMKRSLLTKQLELRDQSYGTLMIKTIKMQFQLNIFGNYISHP